MNHAVLNAKWFYAKSEQLGFKTQARDIITSCILNHMGKWEVSRDFMFDEFLPCEHSWCVHLADNLSSRKNILIDISNLNYLEENLK